MRSDATPLRQAIGFCLKTASVPGVRLLCRTGLVLGGTCRGAVAVGALARREVAQSAQRPACWLHADPGAIHVGQRVFWGPLGDLVDPPFSALKRLDSISSDWTGTLVGRSAHARRSIRRPAGRRAVSPRQHGMREQAASRYARSAFHCAKRLTRSRWCSRVGVNQTGSAVL
jgi:hypothetical protein